MNENSSLRFSKMKTGSPKKISKSIKQMTHK